MKRFRYSVCAAVIGFLGFLATVFIAYGFSFWPVAFGLAPVAIGTSLFVAHKFRKDIRNEKGWRVLPISMMIGSVNVLFFYAIVAGVGGFVVGLLLGAPALFPALGAALMVSPLSHLSMRTVDRWDMKEMANA